MISKFTSPILFLLSLFLLFPILTFASSMDSNYFKASAKKVAYFEPATLNWSVPNANTCYLYGPTSKVKNVPDTFSGTQSVIVAPNLEQSDWQKGKKASYKLVCVDTTELNSEGNYVEIYSKEIKISLTKPKISKKLNKKGVTLKMSEWQGEITLAMNQPKKWNLNEDFNDPTFVREFKQNVEGSITIQQSLNKDLPSLNSFVASTTEGMDVKNVKSGDSNIGLLPARFVEYTFDGSTYKKVVFKSGGMTYYISAQTPTSYWSKELSALNESIKTIKVY